MHVTVNRESVEVEESKPTIRTLLAGKEMPDKSVVVAVNGDVVRREEWDSCRIEEGDEVEIVHAVAGGGGEDDELVIAGERFASRLFLGTGKYEDTETMNAALVASGTEMVTVAIRYMDLSGDRSILQELDLSRYRLLPNTAGATTVEQAVKMARLAREATGTNWLKLEVIGDQKTLWPDTQATVEATKILVEEGFVVLPYTSPDLVAAIRLEEAGASTVMPLASPIGSGLGLLNPFAIRTIKHRLSVPVIVDAGVGTASDACLTMEQGVDGILMNTALAAAKDPVRMATAMRLAVEAGRLAYFAGRMERREVAVPSSPLGGMLDA